MGRVNAAAIYARTSSDQAGTGLGVQRHVEDCERLARERGWTVAEAYIAAARTAGSGAEKVLAQGTQTDALTGLPGNGAQLRAAWGSLNLTRQAAIIAAVLDHAVIGPGTAGARGVDPNRVQPVWRI